MQTSHVAKIDSATPEYTKAFHTFLAHTDQKAKAMEWLEREIGSLPRLETAIDAGAGTGKIAAWLVERFATVIGVEPNPLLAAEFRTTCPTAILIPDTILAAKPERTADLVLCSHVFYYVPPSERAANLRHLMSWLAPGGVLAIAVQNPDTDCMKMVHHFIGERIIDLRELAAIAGSTPGGAYDVRLDTVAAYIRADDLQTACAVAEFILNVVPMPNPPLWADVERYVATCFTRPDGGYQYSCHQDFLRIARRS